MNKIKEHPFIVCLIALGLFIGITSTSSISYAKKTDSKTVKQEKIKPLETTEKLRFKFDKRQWKQVDATAQDGFSRVTYAPKEASQELETGEELFRYQRTVGLLIDPKSYYEQLIETYQKQSPHFYSHLITQEKNEILFEWGISRSEKGTGDATPEYTELQKYMRGQTASHIIRYSRVNAPITKAVKADWIKRFKVASIEAVDKKK